MKFTLAQCIKNVGLPDKKEIRLNGVTLHLKIKTPHLNQSVN